MNIEVNSERSYLGKDIKAWCMSETEDANALEIKRKYYSDEGASCSLTSTIFFLLIFSAQFQNLS